MPYRLTAIQTRKCGGKRYLCETKRTFKSAGPAGVKGKIAEKAR